MAAVFINKIEDGKTVSEGLCLKCAKEMNIPGFDDILKNVGISPEELDGFMEQMDEIMPEDLDMNELFEQGGAKAMPLMQSLMGMLQPMNESSEGTDIEDIDSEVEEKKPLAEVPDERKVAREKKQDKKHGKYKYLDNFCDNLNEKAAEGRMDPIIGRDREIYRVVQILNRRSTDQRIQNSYYFYP